MIIVRWRREVGIACIKVTLPLHPGGENISIQNSSIHTGLYWVGTGSISMVYSSPTCAFIIKISNSISVKHIKLFPTLYD